jgi:hypothetical protein
MSKQQRVVLQLGGWAWGLQPFTVKNKFVMKNATEPQTWMEYLEKCPQAMEYGYEIQLMECKEFV